MKFGAALSLFGMLIAQLSFGQDQVKVMYYNILNYPAISEERVDTLETILSYSQPDLLLVNELTSNDGANTILNNAFQYGNFQKAIFYNGPDTDNLLYYNSDKFGLKSQQQIATALRDISEYVVYHKPSIPGGSDTIFLYLYSVHLKASSGASNEQQRFVETQIMKDHIASLSSKENVFIGGDFNIYSPNEPAFGEVLTGGGYTMHDPIENSLEWHNNYSSRMVHTQSTRSTNFGGGSSGGMDDRFDFIFVDGDVLGGTKGVKYMSGTYEALGQDGQHFNVAFNDAPTNSLVPTNIADALYYMSDHLPVTADFLIGHDVGIVNRSKLGYKHYLSNSIMFIEFDEFVQKLTIEVTDLNGRKVLRKEQFAGYSSNINLSHLSAGTYIFRLSSGDKSSVFKYVIP